LGQKDAVIYSRPQAQSLAPGAAEKLLQFLQFTPQGPGRAALAIALKGLPLLQGQQDNAGG
jgi:hypothetical protein